MIPFPCGENRKLTEDSPRRTYQEAATSTIDAVTRRGLHFGQRKLLLSEVEFFSGFLSMLHSSNSKKKPVLVVYAGAANGQHLPFLFDLFPTFRFVLVDPAPCCQPVQAIAAAGKEKLSDEKSNAPGPSPILELIQDYCTSELCERLAKTYGKDYHLLLVSDIRSGVPSRMKNVEHTAMILKDNELQKSYCTSLLPALAMLKFHPPYPAEKKTSPRYDPLDDTPEVVQYLDGVSLFGVWAPKSSSEVRLVVSGPFSHPLSMKEYSCEAHEEQCYYYNCTGRYRRDCAAEESIWKNYLGLASLCPSDISDGLAKKTVEELSAIASEALNFPDFLPLSKLFTEDHARWFALVMSIKRIPGSVDLIAFFHLWKDAMKASVVEELIKRFQNFSTVPEPGAVIEVVKQFGGGQNCPAGEDNFWFLFCRGDFGEAYSISRVRWNFFNRLSLQKRSRDSNERDSSQGDGKSVESSSKGTKEVPIRRKKGKK